MGVGGRGYVCVWTYVCGGWEGGLGEGICGCGCTLSLSLPPSLPLSLYIYMRALARMCVCERETETETDRQTDRQTDRGSERQTQTDRQTETEKAHFTLKCTPLVFQLYSEFCSATSRKQPSLPTGCSTPPDVRWPLGTAISCACRPRCTSCPPCLALVWPSTPS